MENKSLIPEKIFEIYKNKFEFMIQTLNNFYFLNNEYEKVT
jgi:hypothetical protein